MARDDRQHWDDRHRAAGAVAVHAAPAPPPLLAPHAVDVSPIAIDLARELAVAQGLDDRCRFDVIDLDDGLPPGPPVDVVLCHRFRDARLDVALVARLRPGGLLALVALSEVGAAPGRFRARPGELRAAFGHLDVLADEEGDGLALLLARR